MKPIAFFFIATSSLLILALASHTQFFAGTFVAVAIALNIGYILWIRCR